MLRNQNRRKISRTPNAQQSNTPPSGPKQQGGQPRSSTAGPSSYAEVARGANSLPLHRRGITNNQSKTSPNGQQSSTATSAPRQEEKQPMSSTGNPQPHNLPPHLRNNAPSQPSHPRSGVKAPSAFKQEEKQPTSPTGNPQSHAETVKEGPHNLPPHLRHTAPPQPSHPQSGVKAPSATSEPVPSTGRPQPKRLDFPAPRMAQGRGHSDDLARSYNATSSKAPASATEGPSVPAYLLYHKPPREEPITIPHQRQATERAKKQGREQIQEVELKCLDRLRDNDTIDGKRPRRVATHQKVLQPFKNAMERYLNHGGLLLHIPSPGLWMPHASDVMQPKSTLSSTLGWSKRSRGRRS